WYYLGNFGVDLGNVGVDLIALIGLAFNAWAALIVRTFNTFFAAFLGAGASLEDASLAGGIYSAMEKTYRTWDRWRLLLSCTAFFFFVVGLLWLGLMALPWIPIIVVK